MASRRFSQTLLACTALLLLFPLAACRTGAKKSAAAPYENHFLYNSSAPYDRLLVEIDSVEGTSPGPIELGDLEAFLKRFCDKPGGITLKIDPAIPRANAKSRTPISLASEYLDGPPDDRTAFLYILFYDSKLAGRRGRPANPHFTFFPYPAAIFINRAYHIPGNIQSTLWARESLVHEAGHALGLSLNPAHSRGGHCTNPDCKMRGRMGFNPFRIFTLRSPWKSAGFCDDCTKDLADARATIPPSNLRFHGKYFMRTEKEYAVLSLPGFIYVHVGNPAELSDADLQKKHDEALVSLERGNSLEVKSSTFFLKGNAGALKVLSREKAEPIRALTRKIFEKAADLAAAAIKSDPGDAREILTDSLIDAAIDFPEIQKRLKELQQELPPAKP